ncbi:MAG: hypothetical protein ACAI44_21725, partial [Candidatus Sericytochromatia bacterium]
LQKDGYDEIIFQKGDQLFIAYQKNMDLSKLQVNLDPAKFDVNAAYDAGQLSLDGDAVRVLYVDDENKTSMWTQPFKTAGQGVTSLLNHPMGKAAMLGFVGGAVTAVAGSHLNWDSDYSWKPANPSQFKAFYGTLIGTAAGGAIGGLKAGAEYDGGPGFWDTGAGLGSAALGYGAGALAGWGGNALVMAAKNNGKIAAITAGVTAAVVGTGIAMDLLSDRNKPATMRVINKISEGHAVAPH